MIKVIKNTVLWRYFIGDLNGKLYVKQKGYNNLFNNWIDKQYLVQMSEHFSKLKSKSKSKSLTGFVSLSNKTRFKKILKVLC